MGANSSNSVCAHVTVRGRVQGVFFRSETADVARRHGLSGWVRNRSDGSVEVCLVGAKAAVDAVIGWCRHGPPAAHVEDVAISWSEQKESISGFEIRY